MGSTGGSGVAGVTVRFPATGNGRVAVAEDQDREWCDVEIDGRSRRVRFHDYAALYRIPTLYEKVFYGELQCSPPTVVRELLQRTLTRTGHEASSPRVLDVGAGNGLVGEQMRQLGAGLVVGVDILAEAAAAAARDRPEVYDDYLVTDLTDLTFSERGQLAGHRFTALTCVAALGYGDMPPDAFLEAVRYISPNGWLAFSIKDRFLTTHDNSGFAHLIRQLIESGALEILERQRYQHRLSSGGEPLHYEAIVARRTPSAAVS